jgi:hypothetical protein
MKIRTAVSAFAVSVLLSALGVLPTRAEAQVDPNLPNLVPMFPDASSRGSDAFIVTNRIGGMPTLEFEILTANIGGQDWIRPPIDRDVACINSRQYFRMPQTHEYTMYWFDPDLGDYVWLDTRRKQTICIQDDGRLGNDPQINCLQEHGTTFPCGCNSTRYGPGTGNGVSKGWADSYFRNLAGQWSPIGSNTGDFLLTAELDPDQDLQAGDLLDREKDATHDDNISYVYFTWDGTGVPCGSTGGFTCVTNVNIVYGFAPVCPL